MRRHFGQPGFLQKNVSRGFPAWLKRVEVPKKDGTVHYPLAGDERSLLWLVNQNTVTPHVWTSRTPRLDRPDLCVFDLDPSEDEPGVLRAAAVPSVILETHNAWHPGEVQRWNEPEHNQLPLQVFPP